MNGRECSAATTVFNPEMCMLKFIVKQNIDIISEFARQKNIIIDCKVPDDYYVTADIPMLNTVIRNLISNAVKIHSQGWKNRNRHLQYALK